MHFDEDGHPQNLWGTVYKGGFIVPILQTLFLTVIVISFERWFALSGAKGTGNAGFVNLSGHEFRYQIHGRIQLL